MQTIFFWILLVRHIIQYYDSNPHMRPKPPPNMDLLAQSDVQLSPKEQAQIQEVFELFDTDGGNTIDSDELDAAMFALGFQPQGLSSKRRKSQSLKRGFSIKRQNGEDDLVQMDKIDADGSKSISIDEFAALMKGELTSHSPLEEIWAAFAVLSKGDTSLAAGWSAPSTSTSSKEEWGRVNLDGLRRACRKFNFKVSEEELREMMGEVDRDRNGSVDKEEFMHIMDKALWFWSINATFSSGNFSCLSMANHWQSRCSKSVITRFRVWAPALHLSVTLESSSGRQSKVLIWLPNHWTGSWSCAEAQPLQVWLANANKGCFKPAAVASGKHQLAERNVCSLLQNWVLWVSKLFKCLANWQQ